MSDSVSDGWAVTHHEDHEEAAPAVPAAAKPAAKPRPKPPEKAAAGTPMPVGLTMMLPPEVMEILSEIAESQKAMVEGMAKLTKAITALMSPREG